METRLLCRMAGWFAIALLVTSPALAVGEGDNRGIPDRSTREEIALLKLQLAAQQQQIDRLRRELAEQKGLVGLLAARGIGGPGEAGPSAELASLAPAVPVQGPGGTAIPTMSVARQTSSATEQSAALSFGLGTVRITPVGFVEVIGYVRGTNVGSGLPTNFAGIPFGNTVSGRLSEANLSAQQSRLGFRLDTRVPGMDLLAYVETDFLGTPPGNAAVTTNSHSVRMRLAWVNLTRKKFELLAGQSWSLLTPNRKGISPLPSDIFNTLVLDPNNHVGLIWSRDPQVRFVYHPGSTVTVGVSLEAPSQYVGGSAGAGVITFPSALASSYGSQLNTGTNTFGSPSPMPDLVGKLALDRAVGGHSLHLEIAGLVRRFAVHNPTTQVSHGATGGGGSVNASFEIARDFRLFSNNFYSNGGGRYIFGLGPDLVVRGDGSLSPVRAYSTLDGFEAVVGRRSTVYGYYGGAYYQRNVAIDPSTGQPVGYGYEGSPSNHNRAIQQLTLGLSYTFLRNPGYGGLSLNTQYSYIFRNPWDIVPGHPPDARVHMLYLGMRYLLPGAPPSPR